MRRSLAIAAATACLASWSVADAHHSGAMFDPAKQVTVVGLVKDFNWTNPHSSFSVDVMKPDGSSEVWDVEMNSPNNLVREGWTRTTLHPGDKISAVVHPLRDGNPGGLYVAVTLANGKTLGTPK